MAEELMVVLEKGAGQAAVVQLLVGVLMPDSPSLDALLCLMVWMEASFEGECRVSTRAFT